MRKLLITLLLACGIDRAQSINCGGPAAGAFAADQYFSGSSLAYVDVTLGAAEWIDMRYGQSFVYDVPIASNGIYTIAVELVEPNKTGAGQRIFHVIANGVDSGPVDLFALAGGAKKQYTLFMLALVGNKTLHLQFTGTGGQNAVVSAFSIAPFSISTPGPAGPQGIPGPQGPPGAPGGGGGPGGVSVHQERPAGTMDGLNAVFTIGHIPSAPIDLWRNGIYQTEGVDYTVDGSTISFLAGAVPQTGDGVVCNYFWSGQ